MVFLAAAAEEGRPAGPELVEGVILRSPSEAQEVSSWLLKSLKGSVKQEGIEGGRAASLGRVRRTAREHGERRANSQAQFSQQPSAEAMVGHWEGCGLGSALLHSSS